jgi:hypothetical protein
MILLISASQLARITGMSHWYPTFNIILNGEKTEIVCSKIRNKTRVFILLTLIQYSIGIPSQSNKSRERNKRDSNKEGRSQIILICI